MTELDTPNLGTQVLKPARFARRRQGGFPWYILGPSSLSLAIGLWGIEATTLWFDEVMTEMAASWPLYHLWEAPLVPYYFLMYAWTFTGDFTTDWWLRLSSVIATALAVAFTAVTAKRLSGRWAGLLAGLILALMPSVTRYAQEARVYAGAMMLVSIATALLMVARVERRPRWWIGYALVLVAIGVFAPFAYAVIPAHAVLVMADPSRRLSLRPWLLSCLMSVPVVAAGAVLAGQFSEMHNWVPLPTLGDLPGSIALIALNLTFGWIVVVLALLSRIGVTWLLATGAGVISIWLISFGPSSFWLQRSLLPLAPVLAVAAAVSLSRTNRWSSCGVLLVLVAVAMPSYIADRQPDARGTNAHRTIDLIDQYGQAGDVVSTRIDFGLAWSVEHYLPGDDRFTFQRGSQGRIWVNEPLVDCERIADFDVGKDGKLILCKSLPDDWEAHLLEHHAS